MNRFSIQNPLLVLGVAVLLVCSASRVNAVELSSEPKLQAIADELIAEGLYTQSELDALFEQATFQQTVLDAMTSPAEYKFTWGKYRKLFLKDDRIQRGVEFWNEYADDLTRAENDYGVPASVIVAIIGVESKFGKFKGKHKVIDSLVTLVTGFPRRSKFFAKELKEFLILTKENKIDAIEVLGSYAGAVGYPQFISSSYRNYAVDFSADGSTDLINQPVDAIGSVANYFIENGWKPGEPVTSKPHLSVSPSLEALASRKRKVKYAAADLRAKGAPLADSITGDTRLGVLMLDASEVVHDKAENTYIVRAGDTVCQIAESKKVPCRKLMSANGIGKDGRIFRGQRLKLPSSKPAKVVKAVAKAALVKSNGSKWEIKQTPQSPQQSQGQSQPESENDAGVQARYFFTHRNFYAITQYNHSVLYAMAVHDLSVAIDAAHKLAQANSGSGN